MYVRCVCVCACTEDALSREHGVFGVKTCSLILFRCTLKIKPVRMR